MVTAHIKQTEEFLERIDFWSISAKVKLLKQLLNCVEILARDKSIPLPRDAKGAEFLTSLTTEQLKEVHKIFEKARKREIKTLDSMEKTYKTWNAKITKKELARVSVPAGCDLVFEAKREDKSLLDSLKGRGSTMKSGRQYYFTFKSMENWIKANTNGKIVCKDIISVMERALELNGFGFVFEWAMYIDGKFKENQVDDIQLLVFGEKTERHRIKPPLKHPELLMLYLLFKHIEKEDKSRKMVRINIPAEVSIDRKKTSVSKIYWMIDKIATEVSLKERTAAFFRD